MVGGTANAGLTNSCEDANVARLLWDAADDDETRIAVIVRDGEASYGDIRARAAALCARLREGGIQPQDRVAILLERGVEAVAAYFGALAAGAIVVLVNERLRPRQIEHVLADSGAAALVTEADRLARLPRRVATSAQIITIDELPRTADALPQQRISGDLAQIIYTSGSTGLPKGVVFTHDNLRRGAEAVTQYLGITSDDRIASLLPFSSVYGLNQLLCAVRRRGTLIVELSPLAHQIDATLRARSVTVLATVPPMWMQMLKISGFVNNAPPSLRILQNAGGHLPTPAVRQLRAALPQARLFLQYGMTETFRSTYLPPEAVEQHPDSIGRAIPGSDIVVLREDSTPCDDDEVGELVHRGPTVAAGYWNHVAETERVFRPNPLRAAGAPPSERVVFSGDLVRRAPDGLLYFVGRRDRMIKTQGFRVAPDEIADVLLGSGQVQEAVVAGEPDPERGQRIVAFIVLNESACVDQVHAYCQQELPKYMQPHRIECCAEIPKLVSGKYDLSALHAQLSAAATAS